MREINSFFCERSDRILYHYTGVGSLIGIANTKALWASNIYYMNLSVATSSPIYLLVFGILII